MLALEVAMKQEKETKVWVTAIKLVALAVILIGGVGGILWLASLGPVYSPALEQAKQEANETAKSTNTKLPTNSGWGIAGDSPIRPKR
jgi:flagellar basal body-associated protein FliL